MSEKRNIKDNNLKIYNFFHKKCKTNDINDANDSKYFNYFS